MPGSHGSLTKAGKVRAQTPKVPSKRSKKKIPRVRNYKHYKQRHLLNNYAGQPDSLGAIKARRRRRD
ncbi:30S ribosomal protein S30e [Candidatus Bathyarchaeota archaeon]|nr:30S ribosomal protein S30e [Candidatus Bathyarchaeota archaeon]